VAITYHPKPGLILMCDFSEGFKVPEMIKNRPVIVLTPSIKGRNELVTVVALSTVKPPTVMPYHYMISRNSMPQIGVFQKNDTWLKGDMIYTVGFHRLNLIRLGKHSSDGKRIYFSQRLGRDQMKSVYSCVLHGLNLGYLDEHL